MSIDLEMIAKSIGYLVTSYIEIFVGVLVSPASTFQTLLESQDGERGGIIKLDKRPFVFAAISLLIGLLIGSALSIKDAPSDVTDQIITSTIVPYLFLWLLYGIVFHFLARSLGGKGKLAESIAGLLYVLGTLHPLLLLFIYVLSAIFPDSVSYDLTLRDPSGYWQIPDYVRMDILGFNFRLFYYAVSFVLTALYLYFPLSIIHNLSIRRILLLYIVGMIVLAGCASFSLVSLIVSPILSGP